MHRLYIVQSVLIHKNLYNKNEAINFIKNNNFKFKKIDTTQNYYRFRQIDPKYIENQGFKNYKIKKIKNGIMLVLAYK